MAYKILIEELRSLDGAQDLDIRSSKDPRLPFLADGEPVTEEELRQRIEDNARFREEIQKQEGRGVMREEKMSSLAQGRVF